MDKFNFRVIYGFLLSGFLAILLSMAISDIVKVSSEELFMILWPILIFVSMIVNLIIDYQEYKN